VQIVRLGPNSQNFVKMNIRNSFAILSYLFRMSAKKLSYEKFTNSLRNVYETIRNSLVTFS